MVRLRLPSTVESTIEVAITAEADCLSEGIVSSFLVSCFPPEMGAIVFGGLTGGAAGGGAFAMVPELTPRLAKKSEKTSLADCQFPQPSRHTRADSPTLFSFSHSQNTAPTAGPYCPPLCGRTYHAAFKASAMTDGMVEATDEGEASDVDVTLLVSTEETTAEICTGTGAEVSLASADALEDLSGISALVLSFVVDRSSLDTGKEYSSPFPGIRIEPPQCGHFPLLPAKKSLTCIGCWQW